MDHCLLRGSVLAGAVIAATLPALAADLGPPRRHGAPTSQQPWAPELGRPEPVFDRWTGFYLGGTLGYGFGSTWTSSDFGSFSLSQEGGVGTIHMGYNWQIGRGVIGLETDLGTGGYGGTAPSALGLVTADINAMGSFRGRVGYLLSPALMVYGTAGFAWANFDLSLAGSGARSETFYGYQLGLGSELAISQHVSLRLEYMYTDLERERIAFPGGTMTFDPDSHTVRAGISLKF